MTEHLPPPARRRAAAPARPGSRPWRSPVRIRLFDALGRRVNSLVERPLEPGTHAYEWTGQDARGETVGPSVGLYRMSAGDFHAERRLLRLPRSPRQPGAAMAGPAGGSDPPPAAVRT